MSYQPIPRKPVSEAISDQLRADLLGGRIARDEALPSERVLSEQFGVNRHAVREAIKRLQEAGLVEVTHGGPTRALDWRARGGLDLLAHLPISDDEAPGREVVRSVLEMRRAIGVDVARRCAERAPAPLVAELRARVEQSAAAGGDPLVLAQHYERLWDRLVDGADNLAYRLAYNSLVAGIAALSTLGLELFATETVDVAAQRDLVEAIADGDADAAGALADELLSRTLVRAAQGGSRA
jgi:DNA-binding FadR family transcriptional regulator